jgi:uncharacterized repeat protein (TIGR03803 family)
MALPWPEGCLSASVRYSSSRRPAAGHTQWTEQVLYRFTGTGTDGSGPQAGLVFDSAGALYGTTSGGGGPANCGTVFKLAPPAPGHTQWTEMALYSFAGKGDGCSPLFGRLVFDSKGALYGTTRGATRSISAASGTVFQLMPPARGKTKWAEAVLYSFKGGSDGGDPWAGLIFDSKGALYGTTQAGGGAPSCAPRSCGTVFKLAPPTPPATKWTESVLYRFQGVAGGDGEAPEGGLVFDGKGDLFGTTFARGKIGLGTVFELVPPASGHAQRTETVLDQWKEIVISYPPALRGAGPWGDPIFGHFYGPPPPPPPPPEPPIVVPAEVGPSGQNQNGAILSLPPPATP